MFLINSRLESLAAPDHLQADNRGTLSRSYGRCFAEFLKLSFPEHLRILILPTLVGLRYGYNKPSPLRLFLAVRVIKLQISEEIRCTRAFGLTDGFACLPPISLGLESLTSFD